jgi:hypothetical protein
MRPLSKWFIFLQILWFYLTGQIIYFVLTIRKRKAKFVVYHSKFLELYFVTAIRPYLIFYILSLLSFSFIFFLIVYFLILYFMCPHKPLKLFNHFLKQDLSLKSITTKDSIKKWTSAPRIGESFCRLGL